MTSSLQIRLDWVCMTFHSPNIPSQERIVNLMSKAGERIPAERVRVSSECGLKTRQWNEVIPALRNMVAAAETLRASLK